MERMQKVPQLTDLLHVKTFKRLLCVKDNNTKIGTEKLAYFVSVRLTIGSEVSVLKWMSHIQRTDTSLQKPSLSLASVKHVFSQFAPVDTILKSTV